MSRADEALRSQPEKPGSRRSIKIKLALYFSLVFMAVLAAVSALGLYGIPLTSYAGRLAERRASAFKNLGLIADLKRDRLTRMMRERRDDIRAFATNDMVRLNVALLRAAVREAGTEGLEGAELWDRVRRERSYLALLQYVTTIATTFGVYHEILIIDAESGKVLVSTDEESMGTAVPRELAPAATFSAAGTALTDVGPCPRCGRTGVHFSRGIEDMDPATYRTKEWTPAAVMLFELDPDDIFKPILRTGEGLGKTGEALLVDKDSRIVTSLKHPLPDGTRPRSLEYRIRAKPALAAAAGDEGIIEAKDYRGEQVLAAYRHIRAAPEFGWGLVVKQDKAELFAPLRADRVYTLLTGVLGIAAVVVLAGLVARRLTGPLLSLSHAAERVAEGDLGVRAPVVTSDEVGALATTFNSMIHRIQNWHRDLKEQVEARTEELQRANVGLQAEIVERQRVEEALQESQSFLQTVIDAIPESMLVIDRDHRIMLANRTVQKLSGSDPVVGRLKCHQVSHRREFPCLGESGDCPLDRVVATRRPTTVEHVHRDALGNERIVEIRMAPILNKTGEVALVIESIRDITERKQAEEALLRLNRELEEKNAEMEQFAYTVSHDLKSPLVTIRGFIGHLQRDVSEGRMNRLADYSERIHGATGRMSRLIDELLDFGRIGRVAEESKPIQLAETIQRICRVHDEQIAERGITVVVQEAMPTIYGDEERIVQVFDNLITNAIRYGCDAEEPRIEIGAEDDDNKNRIFVRDNGQGIPAEQHDKIFGLFQRLHPGKDSTGVGLAIVQRIVEVHGGRVWVDSSSGSGATFWVEFPVGCGIPQPVVPPVLEKIR